MAQHKIPTFLSKEFHSLPPEKKKELLERYNSWRESSITQSLVKHLSHLIEADEQTEGNTLFENEFKTLQDYAWHKGYRTSARQVIKQLERDE